MPPTCEVHISRGRKHICAWIEKLGRCKRGTGCVFSSCDQHFAIVQTCRGLRGAGSPHIAGEGEASVVARRTRPGRIGTRSGAAATAATEDAQVAKQEYERNVVSQYPGFHVAYSYLSFPSFCPKRRSRWLR